MPSPIVEGWGDFLSQFSWDWYATWTFADDVKTFTAHNRLARWLRDLEKAAGSPIAWFRGDEYGERFGKFHMHGLIANVAHMGRFQWMRRWEPNGYARIYAYDPLKGAAYYVSKYVRKQLGDWDLSENLDTFRIQQRVLPLAGQRVDLPVTSQSIPFATGTRFRSTGSRTGQLPLADFKSPVPNECDPDPILESFREQTALRRS
jgi:hypothetical protein